MPTLKELFGTETEDPVDILDELGVPLDTPISVVLHLGLAKLEDFIKDGADPEFIEATVADFKEVIADLKSQWQQL